MLSPNEEAKSEKLTVLGLILYQLGIITNISSVIFCTIPFVSWAQLYLTFQSDH